MRTRIRTTTTNSPRVLLIRLRKVGDVVFATPLIRAVRELHPAAHLGFLVEADAGPVVTGNPHLDDVRVLPRPRGVARMREDFALAADLQAEKWDAVVDLQSGVRSAWLTRATRASMRIGYDSPGRNWAYTHRIARPPRGSDRHSVENQWPLLAPLASSPLPPLDRGRLPAEMAIDDAAARRMATRLAGAGIGSEHRIILIHVGAGSRFRSWGERRFAELAARLAAGAPERRILLTSGPSDPRAAQRVGALARLRLEASERPGVAEVGDLSLPELRAVLELSALFVGGDSGPMHVASTSRVPIVGVFGPTTPARSSPWRNAHLPFAGVDTGSLPCRPCDQRRCVPGDFRCLTELPVGAVLSAAERLLSPSEVEGRGVMPQRAMPEFRNGARSDTA